MCVCVCGSVCGVVVCVQSGSLLLLLLYERRLLETKSSSVHTSLWMRANPIFKLSAMEVTLREEEQTVAATSHTLAVID